MDPASAVIGIVSFGLTVIGKVNKLRKAIKGAPQQVRALEEFYVVVKVLLGKLQALNTHAVTYTKDELAWCQLLYERAQMCLHDVDMAVKKVLAQTPAVEATAMVLEQERSRRFGEEDEGSARGFGGDDRFDATVRTVLLLWGC